MNRSRPTNSNRISSYGTLTHISKSINRALGDNTGRTVSRRTSHGLKKSFNLREMDNNTADNIIHASMLTTGLLLKSKKEEAQVGGILMLFALFACYQNGK